MLPLFQMLDQKSSSLKPLSEEILKLEKDSQLEMPLNDLMASYSHMLINRLFKSKQRTHELVLYDFLHRYYKSEIARRKYSKLNAQKAQKKKKKEKKRQERKVSAGKFHVKVWRYLSTGDKMHLWQSDRFRWLF